MDWLRTLLGSELWARVIVAGIIIAMFFFLSRAAKAILHFLGKKIFAKTETVLDDRILDVVLAHVKPLMVLIGLHIAAREIRKSAPPAELTANQILDYVDAILYTLFVVLALKIVLGVVKALIEWYLETLSSEGTSDLKLMLGPLTRKIVSILIGMVAVIIVLDHFGINIGSLLVSLGVGSLAVALAAQDTIANMIAGFVILVDRPFRVGDRIQLANGLIGDVHDIGLRSTRLLNADSNLIIIPNSDLVKTQIVNYAYPHNQMRVVVKVCVAYGTDTSKARDVLLNIASKQRDLLKEPAPQVFCTALQDSGVEFTLVAQCTNYTQTFVAETDMREQIHKTFASEGIEIPIPQRAVRMKAGQ